MVDGPLPAHYEPQETHALNPLYKQQHNPARQQFPRPENAYDPGGPTELVFPYVLTTYRLTEHHTAGGMSRGLPYLAELQPEFFVEVSPALAAERGLEHAGWATVVTARAAVEARVMVTERVRPLRIQGRDLHLVGAPYHWGGAGIATVIRPTICFHLCSTPTCTSASTRSRRATSVLVDVHAARPGSNSCRGTAGAPE